MAFDRTACAEGIEHGVTGWVANRIEDFTGGLVHFFERRSDFKAIATKVGSLYSRERIIEAVLSAYASCATL